MSKPNSLTKISDTLVYLILLKGKRSKLKSRELFANSMYLRIKCKNQRELPYASRSNAHAPYNILRVELDDLYAEAKYMQVQAENLVSVQYDLADGYLRHHLDDRDSTSNLRPFLETDSVVEIEIFQQRGRGRVRVYTAAATSARRGAGRRRALINSTKFNFPRCCTRLAYTTSVSQDRRVYGGVDLDGPG
ncbi:hypothetical protein U1Q18_051324 [Sarracenia purpurea var. burkii]